MTDDRLFARILDDSARPDPYPLYAELRRTPVSRQSDGSYVVSTYREIVALLHDPRVSSDLRNRPTAAPAAAEAAEPAAHPTTAYVGAPSMITMDPPGHARVRRSAPRHLRP